MALTSKEIINAVEDLGACEGQRLRIEKQLRRKGPTKFLADLVRIGRKQLLRGDVPGHGNKPHGYWLRWFMEEAPYRTVGKCTWIDTPKQIKALTTEKVERTVRGTNRYYKKLRQTRGY